MKKCREIRRFYFMSSLWIYAGKVLPVIITLSLFTSAVASDPWLGMTLLSPLNSNESAMIDIDGNVIMTWHGASQPSSMAYYLLDG